MHILCFSAFSALQVERKFEFSCSYFPPSHRRRALACHTNACSAWEKKHVRFENLCSGIFHLLVAFKWWKSVAGERSEVSQREEISKILSWDSLFSTLVAFALSFGQNTETVEGISAKAHAKVLLKVLSSNEWKKHSQGERQSRLSLETMRGGEEENSPRTSHFWARDELPLRQGDPD